MITTKVIISLASVLFLMCSCGFSSQPRFTPEERTDQKRCLRFAGSAEHMGRGCNQGPVGSIPQTWFAAWMSAIMWP